MTIRFASRKLEKLCCHQAEASRNLGKVVAEKLMLRLVQLEACDSLADARTLPGARFHQLSGDRRGEFAVALHGGRRMTVVPDEQPAPVSPDGSCDLAAVTGVLIVFVGDYH